MLRKLRWRFIGAAMRAFLAVILILLCAVNLWNYHITVRQLDSTIGQIREFERHDAPPFERADKQMPGPFGPFSREMRYMTRFFTVQCDAAGKALEVGHDYIASITQEEAMGYAEEVVSAGRDRGFHRNYRYLRIPAEAGWTVLFLNAEREIQATKALLLVSGSVALVSVLAVFVLLFFFSKRAIAPYIRNLETQKRFITDASHELKTPLTAIATSADVLAMEQPEDEWVTNIQTQSARLSRLVSNLVTLSRLDEEQPFPERSDFSLSDAVWEISEPIAARAKARGKTYEQEIEDGLLLYGDRAAIQQMVSILLDNAVRYSTEGGQIRLEARRRQRQAKLTVTNSCEGLDPRQIERLFDRFYRPNESRSRESGGTGIGLSIARATAEAHGGRITAESDGRAITFTVVLPLAKK